MRKNTDPEHIKKIIPRVLRNIKMRMREKRKKEKVAKIAKKKNC